MYRLMEPVRFAYSTISRIVFIIASELVFAIGWPHVVIHPVLQVEARASGAKAETIMLYEDALSRSVVLPGYCVKSASIIW